MPALMTVTPDRADEIEDTGWLKKAIPVAAAVASGKAIRNVTVTEPDMISRCTSPMVTPALFATSVLSCS